jgi:Fe-Mn family superoxide dismutase
MNSLRRLRPLLKVQCLGGQRHLHTPRNLPFDVQQGLGEFLTPEGCKLVALDFQKGLLDRINELIPGILKL